jgi:mannose-6-phosphate isomerase-like protein (cupin superfamily)
LRKVSVPELAARVAEPFEGLLAATVDGITAEVLWCKGEAESEQNPDSDSLYWVHEGHLMLRAGDLCVGLAPSQVAVVARGVSHKVSSGAGATVLRLHSGAESSKKNGRRRLYSVDHALEIVTADLHETAAEAPQKLQFATALRFEGAAVQVGLGGGTWQVEMPQSCDVLYYALDGVATLHVSEVTLTLRPGDLAVVREGGACRLSTTSGACVVRVTRA